MNAISDFNKLVLTWWISSRSIRYNSLETFIDLSLSHRSLEMAKKLKLHQKAAICALIFFCKNIEICRNSLETFISLPKYLVLQTVIALNLSQRWRVFNWYSISNKTIIRGRNYNCNLSKMTIMFLITKTIILLIIMI